MTRLRTLSCLYCRHSSQHVPDTLLSGFSTLRCPNFRHRPSCSFFIQDHVEIPNTLSYIFQALRCLSFGQYSVRFTDNNVSVEILNSIVSVFPDTLRNTYQTLPCLVSRQSELHISSNSPIVCFSDSIMPVLQTGSATHFKHYSVCLLDSILYIFQTPRLENSRRAGLFFSTFRFYVRDGVVIFSQSQAQPFCALCGAAVSLRAAQRCQPKTLWSWMMPRLQARSKQAAASSSDLLAASLQGRGQVVMMPRQRGHSYPRTTPKQLCNRAVITPF